ncbi:LapA family protein [Nocardiopsis suaedae]|uniref:LapA family protein n=1 Tax=Nocardiopsis suaedae TaxID=3018444 RepID=A0ABT4TFV2_9ACTN|nr:LapA family protein [Nocardiopsis suaedae]MDA2803588.1 LapA family protein [Nocardiopsis suaedae]
MAEGSLPGGAAAGAGGGPKEGRNALQAVPPRVWVALVLLVLAVLFILQNRDATQIQVLFFSLGAPLWATLAGAVVVGVVIGFLLRPSGRKKSEKRR